MADSLTMAAPFVPMFFVVRHFEEARVFGSIGIWYTVVVTLAFSELIGLRLRQ